MNLNYLLHTLLSYYSFNAMRVIGCRRLTPALAELTDGDFVLLPQHDVAGRQVAVDDPLLLVQVAQRQTHLREGKQPEFNTELKCVYVNSLVQQGRKNPD